MIDKSCKPCFWSVDGVCSHPDSPFCGAEMAKIPDNETRKQIAYLMGAEQWDESGYRWGTPGERDDLKSIVNGRPKPANPIRRSGSPDV